MRTSIVITLLLAAGACHRAGAVNPEASKQAIKEFFQFAEAGDCARLQPLMAKPEECENIVRQFNETKTHLVSIDEAKVDGRNRERGARLYDRGVRQEGGPQVGRARQPRR